jgi:oligoribonuclease (3'-5' exoribonuclease)
MQKIRPYLALDIETTGFNVDFSQILQIGWVIDDGVSPLEALEKGSVFIENPAITYGENDALGMNAWIFEELRKQPADRKYESAAPSVGLGRLIFAVEKVSDLALAFDTENGKNNPSRKVQLAGKNVSNFDWPIIKNNWKIYGTVNVYGMRMDEKNWMRDHLDHRFLDCGTVFFSHFGYNPGFKEINKLIGWKDINHDALDDAINVVVALRYCRKLNQKGEEQ